MRAGQLLGLSPDEIEAYAQPENLPELKLGLVVLHNTQTRLRDVEVTLIELIDKAEQRRCPRQAAE